MYGGQVELAVNMAVKHGNIAESNYELWPLNKTGEIERINNPYGAISTAGTEDKISPVIVQGFLEICPALVIGA